MTTEPDGTSSAGVEVCVITGMSGAGKSAVANVLEDLGWWVVDNLPPSLLDELVATVARDAHVTRVAVVVDVRGGALFEEIFQALDDLTARGVLPAVLFLEASDEALVRRFESARRPHPLQGDNRVLDGLQREREALGALRARASYVVDTSALTVHQLGRRIRATMQPDDADGVRVLVMSFGFKYGIPVDADLVADLRFLPNPYWIPELRPQTGQDRPVAEYVLGQPAAGAFLERYDELLRLVLPGFATEGKRFLTVAVGCTGGKHRSVATAEALAARLRDAGQVAATFHRDLGRE
jgi:UPF0042 nucleotide-binding protein